MERVYLPYIWKDVLIIALIILLYLKTNKYHRKNVGVNHLAFGVSKKEDVDKFYQEFLIPHGIKPLYNTPKRFPEYTEQYYAIFFEDPDRIKLEVVFL